MTGREAAWAGDAGEGVGANALRSYPTYRDSGLKWLGEVPEHWEVRRLAHIADLRVSNVDKHVRDDEESIRLCNYVDVYHNDRIRGDIAFMSATARRAEIQRFRVAVGDVLLTKDSEDWTDIGVPALVEYAAADLVCGYHLAMLRPNGAFLNAGYLFRALGDSGVARQFQVAAKGVTRYGLSHTAIRSVRVPLPPLAEQAAITRFLDHATRRIRRYVRAKERLIELLEQQKHAIIHQAVTGRIDVRTGQAYPVYKDSRVEWLGEVPAHWERRRLKSLLQAVDKRSSTGDETLLSLRRDHGVVVYADHFARPPQGRTLVGFKLVAVGQLVVNRLQANNGLVFRSAMDGLVSPDYSVFERKIPLRMQYVSDLLRTSVYCSHFRRVARGLGTGTAGFLRLYDDVLLATTVFLPPKDEQDLIMKTLAEATTAIEEAMDRQRTQARLAEEYRNRLIADVVTGKLDVREAAASLPEVDPPDGGCRVDTIHTESDAYTTEHDVEQETFP